MHSRRRFSCRSASRCWSSAAGVRQEAGHRRRPEPRARRAGHRRDAGPRDRRRQGDHRSHRQVQARRHDLRVGRHRWRPRRAPRFAPSGRSRTARLSTNRPARSRRTTASAPSSTFRSRTAGPRGNTNWKCSSTTSPRRRRPSRFRRASGARRRVQAAATEALESLDVAERPQEALCSDQCVGPSCRVGPRFAIIGNAGGCEEVAEPFVDVQLARVASGFHAIAETLDTSQWCHAIGASLQDEGWGSPARMCSSGEISRTLPCGPKRR